MILQHYMFRRLNSRLELNSDRLKDVLRYVQTEVNRRYEKLQRASDVHVGMVVGITICNISDRIRNHPSFCA